MIFFSEDFPLCIHFKQTYIYYFYHTETTMIEQCNFRLKNSKRMCKLQSESSIGLDTVTRNCLCDGEENCILYNIYKNTLKINPMFRPMSTEV